MRSVGDLKRALILFASADEINLHLLRNLELPPPTLSKARDNTKLPTESWKVLAAVALYCAATKLLTDACMTCARPKAEGFANCVSEPASLANSAKRSDK